MSAKKPGKSKPAAPKKSGKGRFPWKVLAVVAALLALGALFLVAKNYHKESVREEVESVVGQLDPQQSISIRVSDQPGAQAIVEQLRKIAGRSFGVFKLDRVSAERSSIHIKATFDKDKYEIELYWEPAKVVPPKQKPTVPPTRPQTGKPHAGEYRLAIVIDDLGPKLDVAKSFLDLPFPVTLAVMPHLAASTEVANLANSMKRPFIIHMPMEPSSHPGAKVTGDMIMASSDPDRVRKLLDEALTTVPGAVGMNNHMGSKATEVGKVMDVVMEELARRKMFFVDSMTSAKSMGAVEAKKAGLDWAVRDIFLDNVQSVDLIDIQIAKAVARAQKNGTAVAIGHGYPQTLEALKRWSGKFAEKGVKVVPVTEVLHNGG